MRIALYQPDIAGNVGTILRLSACFNVPCDIIEPCGFAFSERALKRAGMDYAAGASLQRHPEWNAFEASIGKARLVCGHLRPLGPHSRIRMSEIGGRQRTPSVAILAQDL